MWQDNLRIALDSNETISVTDFIVMSFKRPPVRFLCFARSPNFIALRRHRECPGVFAKVGVRPSFSRIAAASSEL
jgi:hypothetical protein